MSSQMQGIRCMLMRGGTSKGAFFLAEDLPADSAVRDSVLLKAMGSPDPRQIDGVGGAHPLTTKVAVVSGSDRDDLDLEYLFLQVAVDQPRVSDTQNCGNMLAAVGPFALERGMITADGDMARARILMRNTGGVAMVSFPVAQGSPVYTGDTEISGVPGTGAEIRIGFEDIVGSGTGALLPTGRPSDVIEGVEVTLIDNGMPVVVLVASDVGVTGYETCAELEANGPLRELLERIRLGAGMLMNLGDVTEATVPKLTLVAPPIAGGSVHTRTFIPHRCHQAIGVLGALSVAAACHLPGSPAASVGSVATDSDLVRLEHPSGSFDVTLRLNLDDGPRVESAGIIRTARKLMDGIVYPRQD